MCVDARAKGTTLLESACAVYSDSVLFIKSFQQITPAYVIIAMLLVSGHLVNTLLGIFSVRAHFPQL